MNNFRDCCNKGGRLSGNPVLSLQLTPSLPGSRLAAVKIYMG